MHQTGLSPSPLQTGRQTLTSNVGETWNPFYGHEAWHNIVLCSYHYRDTVRKGVAIGYMYVDLCFIMSKIVIFFPIDFASEKDLYQKSHNESIVS